MNLKELEQYGIIFYGFTLVQVFRWNGIFCCAWSVVLSLFYVIRTWSKRGVGQGVEEGVNEQLVDDGGGGQKLQG